MTGELFSSLDSEPSHLHLQVIGFLNGQDSGALAKDASRAMAIVVG
jgi:hypothetical protein